MFILSNDISSKDIPYTKYFKFFPFQNWSLKHFVTIVTDNYKHADKHTAYSKFYHILHIINDDIEISQEIRDVARNLLKVKKVSIIRDVKFRDRDFVQVFVSVSTRKVYPSTNISS